MELVELAFFTDDVNEMAAFYRSLLGVDPVASSDGMAIFLVGGTKIFIHQTYIPATGDLPPENHMAFKVWMLIQLAPSWSRRDWKLKRPRQIITGGVRPIFAIRIGI